MSVISIADLIAQTKFVQMLTNLIEEIGLMSLNQSEVMEQTTELIGSLTIEQKIIIVRGGNFSIQILDMNINLTFSSMDDQSIKSIFQWLVINESVPEEQRNFVLMLVPKNFDINFTIPKPEATLIIVMLNASKNEKDRIWLGSNRLAKTEMKIVEIVEKHELYTEMSVMCVGLLDKEIERATSHTLSILFPIGLILIGIILFITYRTVSDTFLGLLGLGMAIIWMYGLGVLLRLKVNEMTAAVSVLILGLGIDYRIHLILRYREELRTKPIDKSIALTIAAVGAALLLATITTLVGFLSNLTSPVPLVAEFGIFCALGISSCFIVLCIFILSVRQLIDNIVFAEVNHFGEV